MLCEYGCGNEAKFQMKNGKWCCSERWDHCKGNKEKFKNRSNKTKTRTKPVLINNNDKILCQNGCCQEARFKFKNGLLLCNDNISKCPVEREKIKKRQTGESNSFYNKKHSIEFKEKNKNEMINGKAKYIQSFIKEGNNERIRQRMINGGAIKANQNRIGNVLIKIGKHIQKVWQDQNSKYNSEDFRNELSLRAKKLWDDPTSKFNSKEFREYCRKRMLKYGPEIRRKIKKISKGELELIKLIEILYPNCKKQYKVFNYEIDIALPEYKIAIEYDGYYHFDCKKSIDYHNFRQKRIENEGWIFYRVTMFDKFPTLEEVKTKLNDLINGIKSYETR